MLKTRIITALTLLPIVLLAVFWFPVWAWALFCSLIFGAACWEWARLAMLNPIGRYIFFAAMLAAALAIVPTSIFGTLHANTSVEVGMGLLIGACVFWCAVVPWWLATQFRAPWSTINAAAGVAVLVPLYLALLLLREVSPWLLFSFVAIVWVADIAAYFAGKAFGKHKLAPNISPGKTIEGAVGGLIGVALYFFLWRALTSEGGPLAGAWVRALGENSWMVFALFMGLGVLSIVGDLFESWLKRGAGLKDSGTLLPGHGGILDRIDALTSTLPIAALYVLWQAQGR